MSARDSEPNLRKAETRPLVRAVKGPDNLFYVEGTTRLFSGEIVKAEGREAFIGREARAAVRDCEADRDG